MGVPRRYVLVSLKHMGLLDRHLARFDIANRHGDNWLGWERGEKFVGYEIDVWREFETEAEFQEAMVALAKRVGGPEHVREIGPPV